MKFDSQDAVPASIISNKAQKSKKYSITYFIALALVLLCSMQSSWGQIAQRGTATTGKSTTTSVTVNKPSGLAAGDLLIATINQSTNNNNASLSNATLTGWTLVSGGRYYETGNNEWWGTVLYKVATTADVNASNFAFNGDSDADDIQASIAAFSGVDQTNPIDVAGTFTTSSDDNASLNANSITTSTNNAAVIMLAMISDNRGFDSDWSTTSPGSLTELFDDPFNADEDMGIGGAWAIQPNAAATGNGTVTLSGNARDGAILIALRVAPGSTITTTFTSNGTFTVPSCVTSITVEAWGGGGGGFDGDNSGGGKGGGGGGYAKGTIANASGNYSVTVGAGGGENTNGTASTFGLTLIVANGGQGGTSSTTGGGAGGTASTSGVTNPSTSVGGNGGNGSDSDDVGGGGGGAAGPNGAGANGANGANNVGGNGGNGNNGSGGNGGNGGNGSDGNDGFENALGGGGGGGADNNEDGGNGGFPGGGGGGGEDDGGNGANGLVKVTYTLPNNPTISLTNATAFACFISSTQNVTLAYSSITGCADKYSIDFTSGISDIIDANLSGSPITIALPAGLAANTYTGTLTVKNSTYGFVSSGYSISITIAPINTVTTLSADDYVWNGRINGDFSSVNNWLKRNGNILEQASTLPTSLNSIVIPKNQTCVLNQPVLGTNTTTVKNCTIEADASLNLNSGTLNIHGNYNNLGILTPGTGTIAFVGISGNQTITKTGGETFTNMVVNKNSGNVVLANNLTITNSLTLTKGHVTLGTNNLIMGSSTIIGGSNSSYIQTTSTGTLRRLVGTTARIFPVGKSTYNPATLRNVNTASITTVDDNYSVRVVDNVSTNGANADSDPLTNQAVIPVTWMVNEQVTGGSNITMKLDWNGVAGVNSFNPVNAFMAHYISSAGLWDNIGGAVVGTTVEAPGIQSFSPFTISSSGAFAPLPIELVSFQANCAGDENINIMWTTASEHNTSHYVVEHSRNGNEWEALTILAAAGNSTSLLDYTYVHENPNAGTNYYRLTQYDNDGEFEQFNAVAVDCDNMNSNTTLSTYPNPSEGSFYISLYTEEMDGEGVLTITDTKGAVVHTQDVSIQKGNSVFYMNNMQVAPGMYYIQVTNGNKSTDIVKHSLR